MYFWRGKARAATLLELFIAFSLAAMLFSFLFFYYSAFSKLEIDNRKKIAERQKSLYLERRLQKLFTSALPTRKQPTRRFFFTRSGSMLSKEGTEDIFLSFDNGIDWQKGLSGEVFGRLYLDKNNKWVLLTLPIEEKKDSPDTLKEEVLFEDVESIKYSFLPAFINLHEEETPPPRGRSLWLDHWDSNYGEIPAFVKIELTYGKDKKKDTFLFYLPKAPHIIYS